MKRGYNKFFQDGTTYTFVDTSKTQYYRNANGMCYSDCWQYDPTGPRDMRQWFPVLNDKFEHALTGASVGQEISFADVPKNVKAAYTRWEKYQ